MKNLLIIFAFLFSTFSFAQTTELEKISKKIVVLQNQQKDIDVQLADLYKKKVELQSQKDIGLMQYRNYPDMLFSLETGEDLLQKLQTMREENERYEKVIKEETKRQKEKNMDRLIFF